MTVTEAPTNGSAVAAARQAWVESGGTLTGKELAARFGGPKDRQWRNRIAAWQSDGVPLPPVGLGNGNGTHPAETAARLGTSGQPRTLPARGNRQPKSWWDKHDPVRVVFAAIVTGVMAAVSYYHIVQLALLAGAGWPAYVLPLALDGMVALALRCLVKDGLRDPVAWLGLVLGFAGSAAANVYAYRPDLIDLDQAIIVIGLSPAVSFLIAGWLLERGTT